MKETSYVKETYSNNLCSVQRIPILYSFPNIDKKFDKFPPRRPICSGYECCTANISVWLDIFLSLRTKLSSSYIQDTYDFISKINKLSEKKIMIAFLSI